MIDDDQPKGLLELIHTNQKQLDSVYEAWKGNTRLTPLSYPLVYRAAKEAIGEKHLNTVKSDVKKKEQSDEQEI
jgi:hypothetical protein